VVVKDEDIYRVRDALADLSELDPDLPLVLSSDEEGNNVRMVNSIGTQLVRELEHQYMECIAVECLYEYDLSMQPIKVAEVW
jgi:hypothetical protein